MLTILRKYQRIRTNYSGAVLGQTTRPDPGYSQNVPTMTDIKREEMEGVVAKSHITSCSGNRAGLYYNAFTVDRTEPRWKS